MEGNSFFLWNLCIGLGMLVIVLAYITYCFLSLQALYEKSGSSQALFFPVILAGLGLFAIFLLGSFFLILLRDFIAPIMYRDRVTTLEAIQKFSEILSSHFLHFVGYGVFLFVLWLAIIIGIVIVGCGTCCIGFIVLMIPYINAVALLPISYAMRAFSIEFLEQFGPGYEIFPKPELNLPEEPPVTV
jgi:hypothetical protein